MRMAEEPRDAAAGRAKTRHVILLGVEVALLAAIPLASEPALADDPMRFYDQDGFTVQGHVEAGLNAVLERDLFWNLGRVTAPSANFDPNRQWLEGYLKPGLSFTKLFGGALTAYGKLSSVASGTLGIDAFDTGNTGRVTLEEGYLGLRSSDAAALAFDVSVGPREFKTGTGMLLANGATSGFERGALKLGPRKAWRFAMLGRVSFDGFSGAAFYLAPNEPASNNTATRIAGVDLRYDGTSATYAGVTFGHVVKSLAPYPKAAPGGVGPPSILPNARDGLNFVNLYWRANPFQGALKGLFITSDLAYEWNSAPDLQAWGGRVQVGYTFANLPWIPVLIYSYQTFSGDNPSSSKLGRFDPLYFEGSPSAWSTGSKSSMVFINSNVNAHEVALRGTPTNRDTLTLRYTYINVNELRSPIQFGQATRVDLTGPAPEVVSGVTRRHLADDLFLEYIRQLNPNIYLTAGCSVSLPGEGIASIVNTRTPWWGGFVNVVVSY